MAPPWLSSLKILKNVIEENPIHADKKNEMQEMHCNYHTVH